MKYAAARFNPLVSDIPGNISKIIRMINDAKTIGASLIVFPELAITGYPPMDLLIQGKIIDDNLFAIEQIATSVHGIDVICGFIDRDPCQHKTLYNAAAFIRNGIIEYRYHKILLPVYDVFDELRYFTPGNDLFIIPWNGKKLALTICEDVWNSVPVDDDLPLESGRYSSNPVKELSEKGADLLINISASPFTRGKLTFKLSMLSDICRIYDISLLYVNQLGGNDSLIFDGACFIINNRGNLSGYGNPFIEGIVILDDESDTLNIIRNETEDVYNALVLGVRDYIRKCGFTKAILGLSGGIDSAVTAVIAVAALGPTNVKGITMPSMYSSEGSVTDSLKLGGNLGIGVEIIPITEIYNAYIRDLGTLFHEVDARVAEENIQARIRGNILMAMSNVDGSLLLATGNKSELATGYCTLYGDMSGGLAVISDVPKTMVYQLARYINRNEEIIPLAIIDKAPSAELSPGQKDQDTLPPYDILDAVLERYIERQMNTEEIISEGFDREMVLNISSMVDRSEYKRRQSAPGLKVTSKAFGTGRRIPIARKFD